MSQQIFVPGESLHAPHLIDLEIAQVLRRYERAGLITATRNKDSLIELSNLPLKRHSHLSFLARIWELRHHLSAYDAAYFALAEALGARLITRDRAFAAARSNVHVVLI